MDKTEEESTLAVVDYEICSPLSPIVEMEESSIVEDESRTSLNEEEVKTSLETSLSEKLDISSQPGTPPEVLRVRLNSLQNELEELREFTDLERQTYHSDCIPKDQVQSFEEELASLNFKLHQLMQENAGYQNKMEMSKSEQLNLKSQLLKSWKLQNISVSMIGQIKQMLKDGLQLALTGHEFEILPHSPCVVTYGEDISQFEVYEQNLLGSFKSLENVVEIYLCEWRKMQEKVEDLQSETFELNELVEELKDSNNIYKDDFLAIKSSCTTLKSKLSSIDEELELMSKKLVEYENKQIEDRVLKDAEVQTQDTVEVSLLLIKIKKLIETWHSFGTDQVGELTCCIRECFETLWDWPNPNLKVEAVDVINSFQAKLIELLEIKPESDISYSNIVNDYENLCSGETVKCRNCCFKSKSYKDKLCESKVESENVELNALKNIILLEITSLDNSETEESLAGNSLQNLFNRLMEIIMRKENEMSSSIRDQQKEDFHNLELTIDKMNNRLKSQESWTETLESENEKMNTELASVKSYNALMDNKLKTLLADVRNKNVEISNMSRTILELKTENETLSEDLDITKTLVNEYKLSINSLKEELDRCNEDVLNKSNIIKHLESQLNNTLIKNEFSISETNNHTCIYPDQNPKGDLYEVEVDSMSISDSKHHSITLVGCPDLVKDHEEIISGFETRLSEILRKEIGFVFEILADEENNSTFHELFSKCIDKLDVLKDVVQAIGSKVLTLEMRYGNDIQSKQSDLDHKSKELHDLKLSISNLYMDFDSKKEDINYKIEVNNDCLLLDDFTSIHKEVEGLKSDCLSISSLADDIDESARIGQSVVQNLRESFKSVVDENKSLMKITYDLRRSIATEQEKCAQLTRNTDALTKDKNSLEAKIADLEYEIEHLKSTFSETKTNLLLELDIQFPNNLSDSEKVLFVNKTLKQFVEIQNVCYNLTENLRFFEYQCELMLSYIQSMEYNLYFILQQKDFFSKENSTLKEKMSLQNIEINKYLNLIISNSPCAIQTHHQALNAISHVFTEHKMLKEKFNKLTLECKLKQENMLQQQKEFTLLTNENSSLKYELGKSEESIRNLRSELRNLRTRQRRESMSFVMTEVKIEKSVQTDESCCKRLQEKVMKQKCNIDMLTAKITKHEQARALVTSNPYNKQVTYLEGALEQAKDKIRCLKSELIRQENQNQELLEALKRHESCQQRFSELHMEIEKIKSNRSQNNHQL